MERQETQELIEKLRAERKAKGISYQEIVDKTAQLGRPVSLSTVKRVFGQESSLYDFRLESTIHPIAAAILGEKYLQGGAPSVSIADLNKEGLIKMLEEKEKTILFFQLEIKRRNRLERFLYLVILVIIGVVVAMTCFDAAVNTMGWLR